MDMPHPMRTVSQVLEKLRVKQMDTEFRWSAEGFHANKGKFYQPEDLEIVKVYRFEGISDPSDMAAIYIIETKDGLTGYTLDAYGVYSDHDYEEGYDDFLRKIPERGHEKQAQYML